MGSSVLANAVMLLSGFSQRNHLNGAGFGLHLLSDCWHCTSWPVFFGPVAVYFWVELVTSASLFVFLTCASFSFVPLDLNSSFCKRVAEHFTELVGFGISFGDGHFTFKKVKGVGKSLRGNRNLQAVPSHLEGQGGLRDWWNSCRLVSEAVPCRVFAAISFLLCPFFLCCCHLTHSNNCLLMP